MNKLYYLIMYIMIAVAACMAFEHEAGAKCGLRNAPKLEQLKLQDPNLFQFTKAQYLTNKQKKVILGGLK